MLLQRVDTYYFWKFEKCLQHSDVLNNISILTTWIFFKISTWKYSPPLIRAQLGPGCFYNFMTYFHAKEKLWKECHYRFIKNGIATQSRFVENILHVNYHTSSSQLFVIFTPPPPFLLQNDVKQPPSSTAFKSVSKYNFAFIRQVRQSIKGQ